MTGNHVLGKSLTIDGLTLGKALIAATRCLERYRDAINALNVFPVPDGDTGTNMLLTMRSGEEALKGGTAHSAGEVAQAWARGTLLGARGNSGVILSQFLQGLASGVGHKNEIGAADMSRSCDLASQAAYTAMSKPVEGTMLTVMRELSLAAGEALANGATEPLEILRAAADKARAALANTPSQLAVLKEAGVVDAGGQGVAVIFDAIVSYLESRDIEEVEFEISVPRDTGSTGIAAIHEAYLAAAEEEEFGYCIQFLVEGENLDLSAIREKLSSLGHSTGVTGGATLARVHVHAAEPEPILSFGRSTGDISQLTIDDMDEQREAFVRFHRSQRDTSKLAIVAVAQGSGFNSLLRELGCDIVVAGGQSMNPSTQELLDAANKSGGQEVVLLANNPNIILAANQAASMFGPRFHVIPSRSVPQGVAAMLAFNEEEPLETNLKAMEDALDTVATIEVTRATRSTKMGDIRVTRGQYIAVANNEVVAAADTARDALGSALAGSRPSPGAHVTLYWGAEVKEQEAREAEGMAALALPQVEVELQRGGQPLYQYIVSIE